MSKRISQLTELTSGQVDPQNDYLAIVDSSAGQTKKVKVATLTGNVDFGWAASGETWAYNAWDSTIRQGIITVPSDATTKYTVGNYVRFSQTTGGTKWGIIMAVSATTLTVLMKSGSVLTNETITSPVYAISDTPYGFDKDPAQWQLELVDTTSRVQSGPSNGTVYNPGSLSLAVGIGAWRIYAEGTCDPSSTGGVGDAQWGFSTSASSFSDLQTVGYIVVSSRGAHKEHIEKNIKLAAKTTYYIVMGTISGSWNDIVLRNNVGNLVFRAIPAYL